ncbi:MAG: S41 family peptidase [bacterium]|nr:S41 family peptidase [bacterium]
MSFSPALPRSTRFAAVALAFGGAANALAQSPGPQERFAEVFDAHWQALRDGYPYFELYGVDWESERRKHRPRAIAAANPTEFAWEMARLISAMPDPHVAFLPAMDTLKGWTVPDVKTRLVERQRIVLSWPDGQAPTPPVAFVDDPHAYPEVIAIAGVPAMGAAADMLGAGPPGTTFSLRLRWPDGRECDHEVRRPDTVGLPPLKKHLGRHWLLTKRIGAIGYMRVWTFDPQKATLGPDGKITTMLRAALRELDDTTGLILDFSRNGGGLVAASDPFLGNLVEREISYRWGNSQGKRRVIRPRSPRYRGKVVAMVDEGSASGGEWAARILRDAGRATVVGGRSMGAEAAVHTSEAVDGSKVFYSAWPMVEPGIEPFQEVGVALDHEVRLTLAEVRRVGYEAAHAHVRRERYRRALAELDAPAGAIDELMATLDAADAAANADSDR